MNNRNALRKLGLATLALAAGACASGSGAMNGTSGTDTSGNPTPSASLGATGTAGSGTTTNTGTLVPTKTDTSGASGATGVANSTNGTGTGVASLGTGTTSSSAPGVGNGGSLTDIGSDARIVSAIDIANTDEISAGMLARQQASDPRVRAFAQQMVSEHTQMQNADRALAQQARFIASDTADVALQMRKNDQASLQKLQGLSGVAFDEAYLQSQVDAHQRTLALLKASRGQARDANLRSMIDAAIPKVQSHLDQATSLQSSTRH